MIKAIIFDFFGVLSTRALERFTQDHFAGDEDKLKKSRQLREQGDLGAISRKELYQALAVLAGVPLETIISYHVHANLNVPLIDYIRQELKPKYKISILSNAAADYTEEIMGKENLPLFDDMVLSYREKVIKPQPEIYELAIRNLGLTPSECIFIDDSASYCDAAKAVGMQTVWYQDFPQMKSDLERLLASPAAANN